MKLARILVLAHHSCKPRHISSWSPGQKLCGQCAIKVNSLKWPLEGFVPGCSSHKNRLIRIQNWQIWKFVGPPHKLWHKMQLPSVLALAPQCPSDLLLSGGHWDTCRAAAPGSCNRGSHRQLTHKFFIQTRCLLVVFLWAATIERPPNEGSQARQGKKGSTAGRQCDAWRQIRTDSTQICDTKYELASSFARQTDRERVPGMPLHTASPQRFPVPEPSNTCKSPASSVRVCESVFLIISKIKLGWAARCMVEGIERRAVCYIAYVILSK